MYSLCPGGDQRVSFELKYFDSFLLNFSNAFFSIASARFVNSF